MERATDAGGSTPTEAPGLRLAATVVLLRDSAAGPEVLLLERPHRRGAFAGAWVFPGGGLEPEDWPSAQSTAEDEAAEEAAARRAAVRELREETALELTPERLLSLARWMPPLIAPRRFRTWFYLAEAPEGEVVLSPDESVDQAWLRPETALERHAAGDLSLVAPTWVTLHGLVGASCAAEVLERTRRAGRADYATRVVTSELGHVMLWQGDLAYNDAARFEQAGARHRLDTRTLPWIYSRSDGQ